MKKKTKDLHIRMNQAEFDLLNSRIEFMKTTKTQYILSRIFLPDYILVERDGEFEYLKKYFQSISNNVNQIARSLNVINRMQLDNTFYSGQEIARELKDYRFMLESIMESLKSFNERLLQNEQYFYKTVCTRKVFADVENELEDLFQNVLIEEKSDGGSVPPF